MANTEIQYVKKKIAKLESDFAAFSSVLIQAGIKEIVYLDDYDKSVYTSELLDYMQEKNVIIRKFDSQVNLLKTLV